MGVWGHISGMLICGARRRGLRTKMGISDVYILGWVVPCGGLGTSDRHWYFWPLADIEDVNMVGRWGGGLGNGDRDRNYANLRWWNWK